jgi:hypothetical protein
MCEKINIYCEKKNKLININEIIDIIIFDSREIAIELYGKREVNFIEKYHMDNLRFNNYLYKNINYYSNLLQSIKNDDEDNLL